MNALLSAINGITTAITAGNQGTTSRNMANAESRNMATMYRMLPLIILAAVVLIIVFTKK